MTATKTIAPISASNTLKTFLCHAVAANRAEQKTLTLVVPKVVSLQPAFFCDLAESWKSLREQLGLGTDTVLRVDYCSTESGMSWFRGCWRRINLMRCQRAFAKRNLGNVIALTSCLIVSRPLSNGASFVMGICDPDVSLPGWVKPAEMSLPRKG
ncbi:hypothetical protein [Aporhodopirellula aestuarii]|uniref:Uncharacterized protein n=1 Tax=Aporhodopirellula aestuarii TaxID=2950107 RepID=A0ABT0U0C8_9BACT|nr:hypothetical protein [Aporhodopirellula aestuarii]MCM2370089.1 hypothetical protein [Aporhodopirellula aestuarii]